MNLFRPGTIVKIVTNNDHIEGEVGGIKIHHDMSVEYVIQRVSNGTIKSECVPSTMVTKIDKKRPLKIGFTNDSK